MSSLFCVLLIHFSNHRLTPYQFDYRLDGIVISGKANLVPVLSHFSLAYSFSQALILTYKSYYHFPSFPHKWGTLIGMALKIILTRVINKFVIGSLIIQKHTFWLRLLLHHLIRLSDIVFFI